MAFSELYSGGGVTSTAGKARAFDRAQEASRAREIENLLAERDFAFEDGRAAGFDEAFRGGTPLAFENLAPENLDEILMDQQLREADQRFNNPEPSSPPIDSVIDGVRGAAGGLADRLTNFFSSDTNPEAQAAGAELERQLQEEQIRQQLLGDR